MKKKINGFTLIELLAVIVILGILLVIAIPATQKVMEQSKDNTFVTDAKAFIRAAKTRMSLEENLEDEMVFWVSDLDVESATNYGGLVSATLNDSTGKYDYSIILINGEKKEFIGSYRNVVPEAISELSLSTSKIDDYSSFNTILNANISNLANLGNTNDQGINTSIYLSESADDEKHFESSATGKILEENVLKTGTFVHLLAYYRTYNGTKINGIASFNVLNDTGDELFLYVNSDTAFNERLSGGYNKIEAERRLVENVLFDVPEDIQLITNNNLKTNYGIEFPKLTSNDAEVRLMTDKDLMAYFDESADANFYASLNKNLTKLQKLFGTKSASHLISTQNTACSSSGYFDPSINLETSICYVVNPNPNYPLIREKTLNDMKYVIIFPFVIRIKNREKVFLFEDSKYISVADYDKQRQDV